MHDFTCTNAKRYVATEVLADRVHCILKKMKGVAIMCKKLWKI
ncbi:MAG: hypothetical protein ACLVHS_08895 [Blautia wexlerae]